MQHERRCLRAYGEDVSFRDVKIKIPDRRLDQGDVNDVTHRNRARRFWGIWEKLVSWVFASKEEGWLSELTGALWRVPHVLGGRWKSQHLKIVYHSLYVEKPFNSKVIKSFVPELRGRKCFCVSGFYVHFTYPYHGYVTINHYYSNGLLLFWDSFERSCLQISSYGKYFSSLVQGTVTKH